MKLLIDRLAPPVGGEAAAEVVERKGLGHPDTICDALAEQLSVALCRFYLERFGTVLHHNVDKVLLWGGAARPDFGGGEVSEPIGLYLAGRATLSYRGVTVPIRDLVTDSCEQWLAANLHALDPRRHVAVYCLVRPGSADLVELYSRQRGGGVWLANDTSCGVGYAPLSPLEEAVLAAESELNAAARGAHPEFGEDVKVMAVRHGTRVDLTVSCALVGRHLNGLDDYLNAKTVAGKLALAAASRALPGAQLRVEVNAADDPATASLFLTVTGTSAEAGDDGEAGRGNRVNGLITPYRPMTLESAAGKNPVTHVGKLYNIAAGGIARRIVAEFDPVHSARCVLVSRIGRPIDDPQLVDIGLCTADGRPVADYAAKISDLVRAELRGGEEVWRRFVERPERLY